MRAHFLLVTSLLLAFSCSDDATAPADASVRDVGPGAELGSDSGLALWIDFTVSGCQERTSERCKGVAPLSLVFTQLAGEGIEGGSWSLGDGEVLEGRSVVHTYQQPGLYGVTLSVRHQDGTLTETKQQFVEVMAAPNGSRCHRDESCASGRCVCYGSAACPPPLNEGLCVKACPNGSECEVDERCVDLGPHAAGSFRGQICLPACEGSNLCSRIGFSCRLAPSVSASQQVNWKWACLPPQPRGIGEGCRVQGQLADGACLGGLCLDMGTEGYCSASCSENSCPENSRCVLLEKQPGKPAVCLLRCGPGLCNQDSLLACHNGGEASRWAFRTADGKADEPLCVARSCADDSACGVGGRCADGGHCTVAR
jgi:PKD repeat protein